MELGFKKTIGNKLLDFTSRDVASDLVSLTADLKGLDSVVLMKDSDKITLGSFVRYGSDVVTLNGSLTADLKGLDSVALKDLDEITSGSFVSEGSDVVTLKGLDEITSALVVSAG